MGERDLGPRALDSITGNAIEMFRENPTRTIDGKTEPYTLGMATDDVVARALRLRFDLTPEIIFTDW